MSGRRGGGGGGASHRAQTEGTAMLLASLRAAACGTDSTSSSESLPPTANAAGADSAPCAGAKADSAAGQCGDSDELMEDGLDAETRVRLTEHAVESPDLAEQDTTSSSSPGANAPTLPAGAGGPPAASAAPTRVDYDMAAAGRLVCAVDFEARYAGLPGRCARNNYLKGCKWSPCGGFLLTNSQDRVLRVFALQHDRVTGQDCAPGDALSPVLDVPHGDLVYDYCWYPLPFRGADTVFVSTTRAQPIHFWNSSTGDSLAAYRGVNHLDELSCAHSVCLTDDGRSMYAGYNKCVRLFDVARPGRQVADIHTKKKRVCGGVSGIISSLAIDRRSGTLAVASYSGSVGLYSLQTNAIECSFKAHNTGVTSVSYARDGQLLVTAARKDATLVIRDMRKFGEPLAVLQRPHSTNQRLQFDTDACHRYLFSGASDGALRAWSLEAGATTAPVWQHSSAHPSCANGCAVHPSLPLVASASGQRVFHCPAPAGGGGESASSDDDDGCDQHDDDDVYERTAGLAGVPVDNTLKLWSLGGQSQQRQA